MSFETNLPFTPDYEQQLERLKELQGRHSRIMEDQGVVEKVRIIYQNTVLVNTRPKEHNYVAPEAFDAAITDEAAQGIDAMVHGLDPYNYRVTATLEDRGDGMAEYLGVVYGNHTIFVGRIAEDENGTPFGEILNGFTPEDFNHIRLMTAELATARAHGEIPDLSSDLLTIDPS
jgi:hypothetical protein